MTLTILEAAETRKKERKSL
jgi:hypothetical protein